MPAAFYEEASRSALRSVASSRLPTGNDACEPLTADDTGLPIAAGRTSPVVRAVRAGTVVTLLKRLRPGLEPLAEMVRAIFRRVAIRAAPQG